MHYGQFEIPDSWAWVALGSICELSNGISKRKAASGCPTIVLRLADLGEEDISLADTRSINLTDKEIDQYKLENGDLIFVRVNGSKPNVGKTYIFRDQTTAAFCDHLMRGRVSNIIDRDYIRLVLRSALCRTAIDELIVTTAGQNTISQGSLNSIVFPLPPVNEQHRITAAIEAAFKVIDEIEQDKSCLQIAVATIKRKILSLAISGKLVPQDPADGPAAVLLERIRAERTQKEGKQGRKGASAALRCDDNSYYEKVPDGWIAVPIERLFTVVGGGTPSTNRPEYWGEGTHWFSSADIDENGNITSRRCVTPFGIENSTTNVVPKGSVVVVTRVGLGKVAILKDEMCFSQDNQALMPYYPEVIYNRYIFHFLINEMQTLKHSGRGTTISGITKKQLNEVNLWLPPIAEQFQIVEALELAYKYLDAIAKNLS